MANLISFGDLLGQSLDLYEKNWKKLTMSTLWVFAGVIIGEIPNIGLAFLAQSQDTAVAIGLQLLGLLILLACVLPPSIRLNLLILKLAKGDSAEETSWNKTFALLLPTIIVSLLQGLLTLGGFILLIIPGIWLSVALGFATYAFWDEGTKGLGAIKRSYQLVKGRWWATLVRLLVPHFLIGMAWFMAFAIAALCIAILTVLGLMLIGLLGTVSPMAAAIVSYVGLALLIVAGLAAYFIPLIIMTPLSMIPSVKVYLNLKSTR